MSSVNVRAAIFAALLLSSPARAQTPASAAESSAAAAARISVERAKALVVVGDYNAALAELTRAQELLHGDPRQADVLNNMAVCYERMFRYDLALHYYERYLRESTTASAEDRAEVEAAMAVLIDLLGTVRVTGLRGADVWIDDNKLGQVPLEVRVPAGLRVIEIRAPNHEALRRELRVTARTTQVVDAQLEKVERYEGLPSTYFWIATGMTAGALVTGTVLGIAALNEDEKRQLEVGRGLHSDEGPARDLALKADVAFGAAAVMALGATALFFMTDWDSSDDERGPTAAQLAIGVMPGSLAVVLQGPTP